MKFACKKKGFRYYLLAGILKGCESLQVKRVRVVSCSGILVLAAVKMQTVISSCIRFNESCYVQLKVLGKF